MTEKLINFTGGLRARKWQDLNPGIETPHDQTATLSKTEFCDSNNHPVYSWPHHIMLSAQVSILSCVSRQDPESKDSFLSGDERHICAEWLAGLHPEHISAFGIPTWNLNAGLHCIRVILPPTRNQSNQTYCKNNLFFFFNAEDVWRHGRPVNVL